MGGQGRSVRKDAGAAGAAAAKLVSLSQEPGQHPFAKLIITLQAKEAQAFAAEASGNAEDAVAKMNEAVAIEDSIDDLSQPPYPVIPALLTQSCRLRGVSRYVGAPPGFEEFIMATVLPAGDNAVAPTERQLQVEDPSMCLVRELLRAEKFRFLLSA